MIEVIMPKLGLTMEEGTIIRWLKGEGEEVEKGEPLFEVQTDKVVMQVEAPASGTLGKILLPEGETVPVVQVIAYFLEPGEEAPEEWPIPVAIAEAASVEPVSEAKVLATPAAKRLARDKGIDLAQVRGSGEGGMVTTDDPEFARAWNNLGGAYSHLRQPKNAEAAFRKAFKKQFGVGPGTVRREAKP